MVYKVTTTRRAKNDIASIAVYIAEDLHAPQAALNLLDDIEKHNNDLKEMPKKYPLVQDERLALLGIRLIPVNNYLIFYHVEDSTKKVTVIRVMYSRRDWANLLNWDSGSDVE